LEEQRVVNEIFDGFLKIVKIKVRVHKGNVKLEPILIEESVNGFRILTAVTLAFHDPNF
jgi:hypothetical protein